MTKPNLLTRNKIFKLTLSTLDDMLTFATTVRIQQYIVNRNYSDFRTFEADASYLDERESINGTGVLAKRDSILGDQFGSPTNVIYDEVPLASHELGAHIASFPLGAASTSYLFTLLEVFGDDVARLIDPHGLGKNTAWHRDVSGYANINDKVQVRKAQEAFTKYFKVDASELPEVAARRMIMLKFARNNFAHKGKEIVDYDKFLHNTLAVVCHIAFLVTEEKRISVYPWEDHHNTFEPLSEI